MVPAMFHVPISAPTASRMKIAPIAEVTPPMAASRSAAAVWPFLNATSPATIALVSNATCSGPLAASIPNSTIVSVSSAISTSTGMSASRNDGGRGPDTFSSEVTSIVDRPAVPTSSEGRCRRR